MPPYIPREYPRTALEAPIKYSRSNASGYRLARTRNGGPGGLCFETDQCLIPEEEVCVVMDNYTPDHQGPERYRSYITRVRWIKPLAPPPHERFVTGAQIMACSHEVLIPTGDERCNTCDLCGTLMTECQLHCTKDNAQLCGACLQHYHTIPEGKISECIDRFIIGNVV